MSNLPQEKLIIIIGYHGTPKINRSSIEKTGLQKTKFDKRRIPWLGEGVYFFQDCQDIDSCGKKEALDWTKHCKRVKEDGCLVIEATIKVLENCFLDLCKEKNRIHFCKLINIIKEKHDSSEPFSYLTVFDYMIENLPDDVKVIRSLTEAKSPEDQNIRIVLRPQIHVCDNLKLTHLGPQ